jgi:hypothetical protein
MLSAPPMSSQTISVSPAQHNYSVTWKQIERGFGKIGLYAILSHSMPLESHSFEAKCLVAMPYGVRY